MSLLMLLHCPVSERACQQHITQIEKFPMTILLPLLFFSFIILNVEASGEVDTNIDDDELFDTHMTALTGMILENKPTVQLFVIIIDCCLFFQFYLKENVTN
jgi:hypothetical protein